MSKVATADNLADVWKKNVDKSVLERLVPSAGIHRSRRRHGLATTVAGLAQVNVYRCGGLLLDTVVAVGILAMSDPECRGVCSCYFQSG